MNLIIYLMMFITNSGIRFIVGIPMFPIGTMILITGAAIFIDTWILIAHTTNNAPKSHPA
ncbi:MAG: hypothetical protein EA356_12465 [Geminicoccaceae bacterium]|nr:MAG: hypothetical protein EA356_12465 [Geminicoccaceae bacterium]